MSAFTASGLPIEQVLPALLQVLNQHDQAVLEAPPGAGKTTGVPLALIDQAWLQGQSILMLEPRRLAARAAAERMAQVLGENVGETVGYRVRLDSKVGKNTRIEVVTEGILTRRLQDDPALEGVGLLIFDEFHERSLDADLGLALSLQGRELYGDLREQPLKLLVMSATLDGANISKLLSEQGTPASIITSEGRMHPVAIKYGDSYRYGERIVDRVVLTVQQALGEEEGSLLVFLPGQGEIRQVNERLNEWLQSQSAEQQATVLLTPLFGDLSLAEQRRAIAKPPEQKRKVVLATNIAETSLTIDGVRVVIDSGLSRQPNFDPNTGMTRLSTQRLSKASSVQRAGRAGRLEPGVCYRLWSETQQDELAAFTPAEIQQADLAPLALQLLQWGIDDPAELRWLNPPAKAPYQQALDLLQSLDAIERNGTQWQLTDHGQAMATMPMHPRLSHMLIMAKRLGLQDAAAQLAALLGERDPLYKRGVDITLRLDLLNERAAGQNKALLKRIEQQARQFIKALARIDATTESPVEEPEHSRWIALMLAWAYPDRIAKQRRAGSADYVLSNGRAASLPENDRLSKFSWLAVAQLGGLQGRSQDQIFMAAALPLEMITQYLHAQIREEVIVEWDEQKEKLIAEKRRLLGRAVVATEPLADLSADDKNQALLGLVQRRGLSLFAWDEELQQWRARVELLRQALGGEWPDVTDAGLLKTLEIWLLPFLNNVSSLKDFKRLDLKNMLSSLLPWPLPQQLNELAPERLAVPSGSNVRIDYAQSPPVLAVKLQEMFGCEQTPTVAQGRVPLMVYLLSPAQRPLQVTQDLAGFWRGSYQDVKKEMKGRYPKHPWPDNPLEHVATAKTKKRM